MPKNSETKRIEEAFNNLEMNIQLIPDQMMADTDLQDNRTSHQLLQEELIELQRGGILSETNLFELESPNKAFHSFVQTPSAKLDSEINAIEIRASGYKPGIGSFVEIQPFKPSTPAKDIQDIDDVQSAKLDDILSGQGELMRKKSTFAPPEEETK